MNKDSRTVAEGKIWGSSPWHVTGDEGDHSLCSGQAQISIAAQAARGPALRALVPTAFLIPCYLLCAIRLSAVSCQEVAMSKPAMLPRLKFVNGWQLVVMGVQLPITREHARQVYAQLRVREVRA